ncbi:MAG: vitamin K epoxide reductase family protein [Candidatus Woesearchaeota archaeon]
MKQKNYYIIMASIALIAVIVSITAEIEHVTQQSSLQGFCNAFGKSSCQTVQDSVYGKIFGMDTAIYGIVGFSLLLIVSALFYFTKKKLFQNLTIIGTLIGGLMALRFLYLQAFVLHLFCIFCVVVDTLGVILLGIGIFLAAKTMKKR